MLMVNHSFSQQKGAKKEKYKNNFFLELGSGVAFFPLGNMVTTNTPVVSGMFGFRPEKLKYLLIGAKMQGPMQYSPALLSIDSTNKSSPIRYYNKCMTLLGVVGVSVGRPGGFVGGASSGAGVGFIEIKDKLSTCFIWDFTLEGGMSFGKFETLIFSTYSFLLNQGNISSTNQNGATANLGVKIRVKL